MDRSEAGGLRRSSAGHAQCARSHQRGVSPRKPTAIDRHVGKRLRLLRQINEVSLEKLAEIVDVAPQQIQKYEIGETRISASRIFELSKIFAVPLAWFYDDLEAATSAEMYARIRRHQSSVNAADRAATEASQEAMLVTYHAQLPPDMQTKLIDLARMLSELAVGQAK
jgi:transcriptional regulator with XRE-family HTH domain